MACVPFKIEGPDDGASTADSFSEACPLEQPMLHGCAAERLGWQQHAARIERPHADCAAAQTGALKTARLMTRYRGSRRWVI